MSAHLTTCNMEGCPTCDEIEALHLRLHHDGRVIARLLDGWRPAVDPPEEPGLWVETWYYTEEPTEQPMSDGEAAIIRQHQKGST